MILKKQLLGVTALIVLLFTAQAFCQSNASIGGIVEDQSGGVLPGVTVTVTNTETNIEKTGLTNDAGVYNFPGLQVGLYKVTAELPGFQKQTKSNIKLVTSDNIKLNFQLKVAGIEDVVEVSVETESVLLESNPSVGMVLPEKAVNELPLINSNALDLIKVMGGVNMTPNAIWSADQTTLAGIGADQVNVQRDGVTVNDVRYATGMNSPVHLNPEIVGEIKLVVAPVDAEMGRGSGQVQVVTKSGNNQYTGSGVWNIQNSALDAQWWRNKAVGTTSPWRNQHEYTLSFGGPIIKNKTFFFVSWNQQLQRIKQSDVNRPAPTAWAKLGIVRWFNGYSGATWTAAPSTGTSMTSPSTVHTVDRLTGLPLVNGSGYLVDDSGAVRNIPSYAPGYDPNNPMPSTMSYQYSFAPFWDPNEIPISNGLPNFQASDFQADGSLNGDWVDWENPFNPGQRDHYDTTGFVQRFLADMYPPEINNWDVGDGLNYGGFRWTRRVAGIDNIYGLGESPERKQITFRIDHNFNSNHRLSGSYSYERSIGEDQTPSLPRNAYGSKITRYPQQLSSTLTSTLRPTLLNELRFGFNKQVGFVNSPLSTPGTGPILTELMTAHSCPSGETCTNYYQQDLTNYPGNLPLLIGLDGGFQIAGGYHPYGNGRGNHGTQWGGDDIRFVYSDTMTWTKGRHTFRFGGEVHRTRSWQLVNGTVSFGAAGMTYPGIQGGDAVNAPNESLILGGTLTSTATTWFRGLTGTAAGGSLQYVYDLQNLFAGSVGTVRQYRFINSPTATAYNDITAGEADRISDYRQNQFNFFFQDEWRVTDSFSLTLGLRYEQYGVPYLKGGMTIGLEGGARNIFGLSGNSMADWMSVPEFEFCQGCNTFDGDYNGELATMEFVGPDSPNPDKKLYNTDWNNFGPAVGFSWQLPFLGKGKTMLRGGYQLTYATPARTNGTITYAPGIYQDLSYTGSDRGYMDLSMVDELIPLEPPSHLVPPAVNRTLPANQRQQSLTVYDPDLRSPYVQRLTMALIRNIGSNMTLELKYIGNLSRKNTSSINLNSANFINNGLINYLKDVRRGLNPAYLDQMFWGIQLQNGTGRIGFTNPSTGAVYHAGDQLRSLYASNIANGNFSGVAAAMATLNPNIAYPGNASFIGQIPVYTAGAALRYNGVPENFIYTSPQFSSASWYSNMDNQNYHSMQAQFTMRATRGLYFSGTYTWSRNLGGVTHPDVRDRHSNPLDYGLLGTHRSHTLRANGTYELPFGPNRWLFSDVNPIIGKIIGGWQLSWIHTMETGRPMSVTQSAASLWNAAEPNLVGDFDTKSGYVNWEHGARYANYYNDRYVMVNDPVCSDASVLMQTGGLRYSCTLKAFQDAQTGQYIFTNPLPGERGNFSQNTLTGPMLWNTDMNFAKSVTIMEGKRISFRFDAQNIFNHPTPGNYSFWGGFRTETADPPRTSMSWPFANRNLGYMDTKAGARTFQGQVRIDF